MLSQMIKDLWKCFENYKAQYKELQRYYSEKEILQRFYDKGDLPNLH